MTMRRSTLDWARDIATLYRNALHAVDPERCHRLDEAARANGQTWVAPVPIESDKVMETLDQKLTAPQIERFWGVKASTIRSWARAGRRDPRDPSKPLLRQYEGEHGPLYVPREVLAVQSRHRVVDDH
ncbi:hypothetical protein [Nocardia wallacei]|uniref:hypothetical protein n=1 Tax=Nocardia wallacei TaxID=480035 RepID=UPI0024566D7F|nr:hypothetical protein [Nocardia wallacei]